MAENGTKLAANGFMDVIKIMLRRVAIVDVAVAARVSLFTKAESGKLDELAEDRVGRHEKLGLDRRSR